MPNETPSLRELGLHPLPFTSLQLRLVVALFAECRRAKGTLRDQLEELTALVIVYIEREGDVSDALAARLRALVQLPTTLRILG